MNLLSADILPARDELRVEVWQLDDGAMVLDLTQPTQTEPEPPPVRVPLCDLDEFRLVIERTIATAMKGARRVPPPPATPTPTVKRKGGSEP